MKVLIIEDEQDLAELLSFNLEQDGYSTTIASDGKSGYAAVLREMPDLILLDLMLPEMNGIELCKMLKKDENLATIPVIMITAKSEEIDRVVGFEVGADDYLVKPFSTRELLLRMRAVLRRNTSEPPDEGKITVGPLVIDTSRHIVTVDGSEVVLTTTEFKLLLTLVERIGRMQSRDHLLKNVWGYNYASDTRTVDTHITRLRNKLGDAGNLIITVRGFGYKMEAQ